jgi:hypothetical protein
MISSEILAMLGQEHTDGAAFAPLLAALGTVALPCLDEDDPGQHHDWILIRSRGLEIGFVDAAYFSGSPRITWRSEGLLMQQVTFYSSGRSGINAYSGELPYGLQWSDTREQTRVRLAEFEAGRASYLTDRWDIGVRRLVLAYKQHDQTLDSVHVKLRIPPLPPQPEQQPNVAVEQWLDLFGLPADSDRLQSALSPLDLRNRLEVLGADGHEIDFIETAGIVLYFEEVERLQPQRKRASRSRSLAFGAVKFHRARDLNARQFQGELPLGLKFDDNPGRLDKVIGRPPASRKDGPTTGHATWHMNEFSLHVLYSTLENHLFRVMLMAPGYWQDTTATS